MNFTHAKFKTKKKINIPENIIEILQYWNSKGIKKHKIENTNIVKRLTELIKEGEDKAPKLFTKEKIKEGIDKYQEHLKNVRSKLSIGNGKRFTFSIDEFFKFSERTLEIIQNNKSMKNALDDKVSLYLSLKNDKEFYYEAKGASEDFCLMVEAIKKNFSNDEKKDSELEKFSGLSLEAWYNDHIKRLVLCQCIATEYEWNNKEIFQTKELFFHWISSFINEKFFMKFQMKYLNSRWFYEEFKKFMINLGRYTN